MAYSKPINYRRESWRKLNHYSNPEPISRAERRVRREEVSYINKLKLKYVGKYLYYTIWRWEGNDINLVKIIDICENGYQGYHALAYSAQDEKLYIPIQSMDNYTFFDEEYIQILRLNELKSQQIKI